MSASTELKIIGPEDLQGAELILATNKGYVATYQKKFDKLLAKAEKEGTKLTPETDKEINDYLVSNKTCLKKMEEDRKPFTSKLQEVVKLFTTEENKLKDDLYTKLQAKRDASVKAWAIQAAEDAKAAQAKLDAEKERILLLADAEAQIRNAYADILAADKTLMMGSFENATAETIDEVVAVFEAIQPEFTQEMFDGINPVLSSNILPQWELDAIVTKAKEGKLEKIQPHYTGEIRAYANHLLTLIPERRAEIEAGIASKAADDLRATEAETLRVQQEAADKANQLAISNQVAAVVMDSQIQSVRDRSGAPSARSIESYTINVTKREGWAEIFKFYFTHSDEADLGKIKMDQMKAFAEKLAKSQNIKIESDAIEYEAKYKAVAKKAA